MDVKHLLQYKSIKFSDFVDAEFSVKASGLMLGCCVIVLSKGTYIASCGQIQLVPIYVYNFFFTKAHFICTGGKSSSDPIQVDESTIAIGCWKGRNSLSVMVTALDCQELLERLLMRIETGNGLLETKDEAFNAEGDDDMKDAEKNGDEENATAATEG